MSLRKCFCVALTTLVLGTAQAQVVETSPEVDNSPSAVAMALDLAVARPLGLAVTVLGGVVFIAQLPLDLLGWQSPAAPARKLVMEPARFTFTRSLGDFE